MLREVPPGEYTLDASVLNPLIRAANAILNLRVIDTNDADGAGRSSFKSCGGGSILRIVHPSSSGVPAGGIENDVLTKQSSTDGDAAWESPGSALNWRNLTAALSVAGIVPTSTEINTALALAYTQETPDLVPADGDRIILTVSTVPKFFAYVGTASLTASGLFLRSFVVNSVTYYATVHECGLY